MEGEMLKEVYPQDNVDEESGMCEHPGQERE